MNWESDAFQLSFGFLMFWAATAGLGIIAWALYSWWVYKKKLHHIELAVPIVMAGLLIGAVALYLCAS